MLSPRLLLLSLLFLVSCQLRYARCSSLLSPILEVQRQHQLLRHNLLKEFNNSTQILAWCLYIMSFIGLFEQLQLLPSHLMLAFEETFYMVFFEVAKYRKIINPLIMDYATRHMAFQETKQKKSLDVYVFTQEQRDRLQDWRAGLSCINKCKFCNIVGPFDFHLSSTKEP